MHYPRTYLTILEFDDPYFNPDKAYNWGDDVIPKYLSIISALRDKVQSDEERIALEEFYRECITLYQLCINASHHKVSIPVVYEGYHLSETSDMVFDTIRALSDLLQREMSLLDMTDPDIIGLLYMIQKTDKELAEVMGDYAKWEQKARLFRDARGLPVIEEPELEMIIS